MLAVEIPFKVVFDQIEDSLHRNPVQCVSWNIFNRECSWPGDEVKLKVPSNVHELGTETMLQMILLFAFIMPHS